MTTRRVVLLLLPIILFLGLLLGAPARGEDDEKEPTPSATAPHVSVKRGPVTLKEGFREEHTKVKLGDQLSGTASLEIRDWFDAKAITGQLDVKNPTKSSRHISYNLAFFDENGVLLGAANQNMEIEAGEETSIGGAVILVSKANLAKVASYQIAYYEDEKPIGRR